MGMIPHVAFLAAPNDRSKIYLQQMAKSQLLPSAMILLDSQGGGKIESQLGKQQNNCFSGFDLSIDLEDFAHKHGVPCHKVQAVSPNACEVIDAVQQLSQEIVIYSGPGGAILKKTILELGKRFLHIHSGNVPDYRGSTTVYYSLLREGNLAASAMFLDAKIDTGPVIKRRFFSAPEDRTTIDRFYDSYIRSELLVEVLSDLAETKELTLEQQPQHAGTNYYIIHPILKHIAILAKN